MQRFLFDICQNKKTTMKISIFLRSLLMISVVSCKKESEQNLQGEYKGIFFRTSPAIDYIPSNVTLTLDNKSFSGSSDVPKYPAICSGSWNANNKSIWFTNKCAWTADFDHTLILDGQFQYEWKGETLYIRKTRGQSTDVYQLNKQ